MTAPGAASPADRGGNHPLPAAVAWNEGALHILDQTRLPAEIRVARCTAPGEVFEAIRSLKVRGAPAIGIAAAYGLCLAAAPRRGLSLAAFRAALQEEAATLAAARPTAVNLRWALDRLLRLAAASVAADSGALHAALVAEAVAIHDEDRAFCRAIGEAGRGLIRPGMGVLTHCNAGALATSELGTATAPLYLAHAAGVAFRVYADETRPLLQGARLTAWELQRAGLDVTLITDNMAADMMARGHIDLVITGADRVAANGDAANKIGTLGVAVLARHFGVPFYVACPSSTVDLATAGGRDIPIEERGADEVTSLGGRRIAPEGIKVRNPAFDVTPADLIAGLITERGVLRPPYAESLRAAFGGAQGRR